MLIHKLPNISRVEGNQTMKFGQLIECNMRNIFLEKSYTKCGDGASHRLVWLSLLCEISDNMCIAIVVGQVVTS